MTYGCHNRPLLPPAADVFSPRCNYDRRERDAGCEGCRFRARENEVGKMAMHLWEIEHPYYCNQGNYYGTDGQTTRKYETWAEFSAEESDAEINLNLVFRWDWYEGEDWGVGEYTGDDYYRNGKLFIFFMGQRRGLYRWAEIAVCRADESAVLDYLRPRWEHMRKIWEPISGNVDAR